MEPTKLIESLSNEELMGIADALPKAFAERSIELPVSVGGVAVNGSQTEAITVIPTWEQQLAGLSPERQETAKATREALVKKYEAYDYTREDFSLIKTTREVDGKLEDIFAVVLSATNPIDLGDASELYDPKRSWNSLDPTKPNKQFMVEVDSKQVDERAGLTLEVMTELASQNPDINEWIWETGAPERAVGREMRRLLVLAMAMPAGTGPLVAAATSTLASVPQWK